MVAARLLALRQRAYFPAVDYKDKHRLVIATPSAATKEPARRWVGEADDAHLRNIVEQVFGKYGPGAIKSFWLVGHSQGGMTSSRLLREDPFFQDRVDGWLSLSGGRLGAAERAPGFSLPVPPGQTNTMQRPPPAPPPECDFSFIFATGEHEIAALPETSPWAEKYGAGARERLADVVDSQPGQIYDTTRESYSNPGWGLKPGPGSGQGLCVSERQGRPGDRRRGAPRQGPHRGPGAAHHRDAGETDGRRTRRQGEGPRGQVNSAGRYSPLRM